MDRSEFTYPVVNLGIYAPNFTGKCGISFYERDAADQELHIYIIDLEQPFGFDLSDEKVSPLMEFPLTGKVFGVDLDDDGFNRVVCNDNARKLFLIDLGEVIDVAGTQLKMVSLSDKAQQTAAKAIPCTVVEMLDEFGKQIDDIANICDQLMFFTVLQVKDNGLVVKLSKIRLQLESDAETATQHQNGTTLTQEQHDMLFEEPEFMTTNAMRAVYGYDPKDDQRLCPHYDPKTGACWKGNTCTYEHGPKLEDGWTTDRKPATISLANDVAPLIGSTVKVCITRIRNVDDFHVHIPEISAQFNPASLNGLKNQMNKPEMVKQYKPSVDKPKLLDLVLVKRENIFYRGKVVDYDESDFTVNFLDYGYTESVSRKDIYQWHPMWNLVPAQAYQCCLENVQTIESKDKEVTDAFRNLILHSGDISAKIISYNGDLIVRLHDSAGVDIGESLCAYGLVELKPKIVPTSTKVPG